MHFFYLQKCHCHISWAEKRQYFPILSFRGISYLTLQHWCSHANRASTASCSRGATREASSKQSNICSLSSALQYIDAHTGKLDKIWPSNLNHLKSRCKSEEPHCESRSLWGRSRKQFTSPKPSLSAPSTQDTEQRLLGIAASMVGRVGGELENSAHCVIPYYEKQLIKIRGVKLIYSTILYGAWHQRNIVASALQN